MNVKATTLLIGFIILFSKEFTVQAQTINRYSDASITLPTVSTDRDDYAPGQIAVITGVGWTLDSLVDVHLEEDPTYEHSHDYHNTKVEPDGTWRIEYPIEERHIGVRFTVMVNGKSTNFTATADFTDAPKSWDGGGDGVNWSSPKNWNPDGLPTISDDVTINGGFTVRVDTDRAVSKSLTLGLNTLDTAIVIFNSGAILNVSEINFGSFGSILRRGSVDMTNGGQLICARFRNYQTPIWKPGKGTVHLTLSNPIPSDINVFHNLIVSQTSTLSAATTITGDLTINYGAILDISENNYSLNVEGNWIQNGLFQLRNGTVSLSGGTQTLKGNTSLQFHGLKIAGSGDKILQRTIQVNGILDLTNNLVQTGGHQVIISTPANIVGGSPSSYVNGQLLIQIPAKNTRVFHVGKGGVYRPVAYTSNASRTYRPVVEYFESGFSGTYPGTTPIDSGYWRITSMDVPSSDELVLSGDGITSGVPIVILRRNSTTDSLRTLETSNSYISNGYKNADGLTSLGEFALARKITATIITNNASAIYGDTSVDLSANVTPATFIGDIEFFINDISIGTTSTSSGLATFKYPLSGLDAGEYTLKARIVGAGSQFNDGGSETSGNLTIQKRRLTVTGIGINKVYDGLTTASISISDDRLAGDQLNILHTAANFESKNSGINKNIQVTGINIEGSDANNYFTNATAETFADITPRPITVTVHGQSKTYGENDPDFSVHANDLIEGDIAAGSLSRETGENVGTYAILKGSYTFGLNYNESYKGNNLLIGQRNITITAKNKAKTYGENDPAFSAEADDIVQGDVATGSLNREPGEDVGTYAILQGSYTFGPNYNESYKSNNLVIGQRNITIRADSQAKTYGDSDPEFTAQADGVIEGDVATGFLSRQAGENAGTYAILKGSYTFGPNYKETYSNSNLVISPRNITITANAMDKYCGQPDPILTYSVTNGNLVNEDTVSGSLGRDVGENIGEFEITKGTLALNSNYSLSYTGALFNIKINSIDGSASSNPVKLNDTVELSATVKDVTSLINNVSVTFIVTNGAGISVGEHTAVTNNNGIATAKVYGLPLGLYQIKAIVGNGCSESIAYLPVYDPNSSFITGGGWINSPPGALVGTTVTGKANFGFVAKYKKGNNTVDGNTEFQFQAGSFNFKSTFLNAGTLIISGGKATYKGEGTVNGSGNYEFVVSAFDGEVNGKDNIDKFRIKIWIKGSPSNVIYDNLLGFADNADLPEATTLGGGSVVIHEVKGGKQATSTPTVDAGRGLDMKIIEPVQLQKSKLTVYPNPFAKNATIAFTFPTNEQMVSLDIYDLKGSRITRIFEGKAEANQTLKFDFNGSNLSPGLYLLRLTSPTGVANFKMIMTE